MGGMPNVGQEGERPVPVLDRKPPLPKTASVRIIGHKEDINQEQALVLVMTYGEESSCSQSTEELDSPRNAQVNYRKGQFNMNLNTLMFIVG